MRANPILTMTTWNGRTHLEILNNFGREERKRIRRLVIEITREVLTRESLNRTRDERKL